ncbi:MAG: hypothetical protein HKN80_13540, partial [Acidimicrobiia bacterium]|nr:hypothetical protein [Acidimicrobiia bacterium]
MSENSSRDSQPAIREVGIEESGIPRTLERSPPASRPWVAAFVIAAAVAGLAYGFLLGRGGRPDPTAASALSTTTTSTTPATSAVTSAPESPFPESLEAFVRAAPGHSLGRGVTEYLNPNRFYALAVDGEGIVWAGGPSGVVRLDPATGEFTKLTETDGTGPLDVTELSSAPDGSVWAATDRGLSHWDGEAWSHDSGYPRSYAEHVWTAGLEVGTEGDVWLASYAFQPGDWAPAVRIHRLHEPYA